MKNNILSYFFVAVALLFISGSREVRAQQLAFGTDALMLGAMAPNVTAELVTGEKTSVAVAVVGACRPWGKDFKGVGVRPEFKVWLAGRPMIREYLGVTGVVAAYDFSIDNKTRNGMMGGLGVTGGYMFRPGERFAIELSAGSGLVYYSHKLYRKGENYGDIQAKSSGFSIVPLKFGVTFYWILK